MSVFPGTSAAPEGTSQTFWAPWAPPIDGVGSSPFSTSRALGITVDASALTDSAADTYQVLGSNEAGNADAVPVVDDNGVIAARLCTVGFSKAFWPYKYIGIKYTKGGGTVTGNYTVYWNAPMQGVQIN